MKRKAKFRVGQVIASVIVLDGKDYIHAYVSATERDVVWMVPYKNIGTRLRPRFYRPLTDLEAGVEREKG